MEMKMVKELLLQSLEHEMGGVKVYETALKCVQNEDLKEEWEKYLEETEKHVQVLHDACLQMNLDPEEQTPGRKITHDIGASLIAAMEAALGTGDKEMAQCVACEMVTHAEMTDHFNWQLIGEVSKKMTGADGKALKEAYQEVEDEEDEHFYHSKGWLRELSMQGLGLKAVLPPPEEEKHVKSASAQARVEQQRRSKKAGRTARIHRAFRLLVTFRPHRFSRAAGPLPRRQGRAGRLLVEPYKSEILPLWRFRTPALARRSSAAILRRFRGYRRKRDFVGRTWRANFLADRDGQEG